MSKSILRVGIAALVVALVVALPGTAAAQDQEDATTRLYPIHNVRVDSAYTLAQSICEEAFSLARNAGDGDNGQRFICQVVAMSRNRTLAVSATPELHARIAGMLVEFDRMPETKAFHIIVLSAGTMTTSWLANRSCRVSNTIRPAVATRSICAPSALKKRSIGAPSISWVASVSEPAKLNETQTPVSW